jgi:sugar phosphate isomerase/epimerase
VSAAAPEAVGSTIAFARADLESALDELTRIGFDAAEIWIDQLGPGPEGPVVAEAHATAAAEAAASRGLRVASLNAVGDPAFAPLEDPHSAVTELARQLRLAVALGAPKLLVWEGRLPGGWPVERAAQQLAAVIERGRVAAKLPAQPVVCVEPHPFTFGLAPGGLDALHAALAGIGGAGLLFDYCHVAVGLGADEVERVAAAHRDGIAHVHASDSDGRTSELHFPFGKGRLDLPAIAIALRGSSAEIAWDLFGWPEPRTAHVAFMDAYRAHAADIAANPDAT